MPISLDDPLVGTNLVHALAVALGLFAITVPIAIRLGQREERPWLTTLVLVSFGAHLLGSALQVVVVARVYENVADFHLYDGQGADLLEAWKSGSFPLDGLEIPGTGTVSIVTGAVYALVGVDQLGGFFVFSWLGLLGLIASYRAFRLMVPDGNDKLYAVLLFLMPSLFYWPSVAGKEAVMLLALSWMALGAAYLFAGQAVAALRVMAPGLVLGSFIRPHEVALLFGAFCLAILLRPVRQPSLTSSLRKAATIVVVGSVGVVIAKVTASFLGISSLSPAALAAALNDAHVATQGEGEGFESSHSAWNPSPLYFPEDVYLVLFKPLPFEATEMTQVIASIENVFILLIVLYCWRSILSVPRHLRSPYIVMATVYSLAFLYLFASLGNVGLLVRERTLLFPLFFVLFALPPMGRRKSPAALESVRPHVDNGRRELPTPRPQEVRPGRIPTH